MCRGDDMSVASNVTLAMHTSPFGSSADGSFAAISQARSNRGRRESDYWGRMVRGSGNVAVRSAVEQAVLLKV